MSGNTVLYLGRRGGGARLTNDLAGQLLLIKQLDNLIISSKNELLEEAINALGEKVIQIDMPHPILQLIAHKRITNQLRRNIVSGNVIIPMSSLIDTLFLQADRVSFKITRIVHDIRRHPGDFWPTTSFIKRSILNSDSVISLNSISAEYIERYFSEIDSKQLTLPASNFLGQAFDSTDIDVLFIGRIRKYKNLKLFAKCLDHLTTGDYQFVVAGQGRISRSEKKQFRGKNVTVVNRWLDEKDLHNFLSRARVVVFPYKEASQSGILAWCLANGKKIVITPNEFLMEQTRVTSNERQIFVSESFLPLDFARSINDALIEADTKSFFQVDANSIENFVEALIR
jgi:glycosyltransferase involved in cell wall biosynthesis